MTGGGGGGAGGGGGGGGKGKGKGKGGGGMMGGGGGGEGGGGETFALLQSAGILTRHLCEFMEFIRFCLDCDVCVRDREQICVCRLLDY
jgi:hypothetical protein